MSDELNKELEKPKSCKCLVLLVIASFLISLVALGTSVYTLLNGSIAQETNKKVVISTQYDKGKSLEKAKATKKPVIVFFYTDWCGYCQRFAPTYHKFSKDSAIKKNFAIAYVNCEDSKNRSAMEEYNVHAFPTVFVVDKDGIRTQLENRTFFEADAIKTMKENALKAINASKEESKN